MVYITAIHLAGGSQHQHIQSVRWRNPADGASGQSTRAAMVDWIDNQNGDARVRDEQGHEARVGVWRANPPYIRTYADGDWNNNLLALPKY